MLKPNEYAEVHSSIDCLEFLPYGDTDRGVIIRDRSRNRTSHIWFSSPEEQNDFLDLVNEGIKLLKSHVVPKSSATKVCLRNLQQRKLKFRGKGDPITTLNLGEWNSLIPGEFTV